MVAHAKINTYLEVHGKRPDGYHELATEMSAIGLADTLLLTLNQDPTLVLDVNPPIVGMDRGDNLVLRAARLLLETTKSRLGARISLFKRIPVAAGLGGGSADAAATLIGLNRLWRLGLSKDTLVYLARRLGADVPFFVQGSGRAYCTGRGDVITPIAYSLSGRSLMLVALDFTVPTPRIFQEVRPSDMVVRRPENALLAPAERLFPEIAGARRNLQALTGRRFCMSGSGPTLFHIAEQSDDLIEMARLMRAAGYRCWRTHEVAVPVRYAWARATTGRSVSAVTPL